MTTVNPFTGMNPYFEQEWRDAHTMLIGYLRDALQEQLPAELVARAEKESVSMRGGQGTINYRPDVQAREPWTLKELAAAAVAAPSPSPTAPDPTRCSSRRRWNAGSRFATRADG